MDKKTIAEIQATLAHIQNGDEIFFNIVQYQYKMGLVKEYGKTIKNKTRYILTEKGHNFLKIML